MKILLGDLIRDEREVAEILIESKYSGKKWGHPLSNSVRI
jgi:hypothetical protein